MSAISGLSSTPQILENDSTQPKPLPSSFAVFLEKKQFDFAFRILKNSELDIDTIFVHIANMENKESLLNFFIHCYQNNERNIAKKILPLLPVFHYFSHPSINDELHCIIKENFKIDPDCSLELLRKMPDSSIYPEIEALIFRLVSVDEPTETIARCMLEVVKTIGSSGDVSQTLFSKSINIIKKFFPNELLYLANKNFIVCMGIQWSEWPNSLQLIENQGLIDIAYSMVVQRVPITEFKNLEFRGKILNVAISADNLICLALVKNGVSFQSITNNNLLNQFFSIACRFNEIGIAEKILEKISNANINPNEWEENGSIFSSRPMSSALKEAITIRNETFIYSLIEEKMAKINSMENIQGVPLALYVANNCSEKLLLYFINKGICKDMLQIYYFELLAIAIGKKFSQATVKIIDQIDTLVINTNTIGFINTKKITNLVELIYCNFESIMILRDSIKLLSTKKNSLKLLFFIEEKIISRRIVIHMKREAIAEVEQSLSNQFPDLQNSIREFFIDIQYETDIRHYENIVDISIPQIPNKPVIQPQPFANYIEYFPYTNFTDNQSDHYVSLDNKLLYVDPKMIEKLFAQFKKINFSDPTKPGYLDPETIFHFLNETEASIQIAFERFIIKLVTHEAYAGTPKEFILGEDGQTQKRNPGLDLFYDEIEAALYHILNVIEIEELKNPEEAKKTVENFVCELLRAGPTCGGGINTRSIDLYMALVLHRGEKSYKELLDNKLETLRRLDFTSLIDDVLQVSNNLQSVHTYGGLMRGLGKRLGISGASAFEKFDDEFAQYVTSSYIEEKFQKFLKIYIPSQIIDWVLLEFKQTEALRTLFTSDWLKKNILDSFKLEKSEHYKNIIQGVKKEFPDIDINAFKIAVKDPDPEVNKVSKKIIEFLQTKEIYIKAGETIQETLDEDLVQEYLGYIWDPKNARAFEQQVIDSLVKLEVIKKA